MNLPRSSGILLHPTSLPGGRLGPEAYAFVDWLRAAGQSWWQLLPLGPPDEYGSPYKAASAFAGWTGLLAEPEAPVSAEEVEDFVAIAKRDNPVGVASDPDIVRAFVEKHFALAWADEISQCAPLSVDTSA